MLWTIPTISALLATPGAAVATAPPAFATEFSLSYVVTNHAYGFMTVGVWRVDHKDSTGTLNLREREDTHNTTLHPQSASASLSLSLSLSLFLSFCNTAEPSPLPPLLPPSCYAQQVKDYKHYLMTNFDPGLPAPTHACTSEIAAGVTQPRWVVAPNATNIAPPSVGHQRWREYHASQGICVDFYVNGSSAPRPTAHSSSSEGSAPMLPTTINARMNILPYLIEYYAGCTYGPRL